jgi:hypothetical protein
LGKKENDMKKQALRLLPTVILFVICLQLATEWAFARFVHYHAQRQTLAPAHYTVDVIPVLSGMPYNRQTDFRKSEDGQYYVRVATLGTAHHMARTTSDLLSPFLFALSGLIVTLWIQRKQIAKPNHRVELTVAR